MPFSTRGKRFFSKKGAPAARGHMDRSRYKWSKIIGFHDFYGVFAIPSAKMVPGINQIASENDLRAADSKYAVTLGVGGGKMWSIVGNSLGFCRSLVFEVLDRRIRKSKTWRSARVHSSSRDRVLTRVSKAISLMAFSLSLGIRFRGIRMDFWLKWFSATT